MPANRRNAGHKTVWESAKVSHKRMFALLTPEIRGWKMAAKTSVRAPGLSTDEREHWFWCDTLGLAEDR